MYMCIKQVLTANFEAATEEPTMPSAHRKLRGHGTAHGRLRMSKQHASCVRNTATAGVLHHLHVLEERSLGDLGRRRLPGLAPTSQLLLRDPQLNRVLHCVHGDDVPILYQSKRAPYLSLWYDVSDTEAVRAENYLE